MFEAGPNVKVRTHDPKLAEFLTTLVAAFPLGLPLEAASETPVLADHVFRLFTTQIIELAAAQWPLAAFPGERPKVSALARLQAEGGESVLRHAPPARNPDRGRFRAGADPADRRDPHARGTGARIRPA